MYLKLIFNMYNNLELKLFKFKNIKKSYYYSFIDLDEKYYQFDNIDLISKYKIIKNLKKRFVDKNNLEFKFNKDCLEVINKKTKQKIINLSSGEKKIMQLYKALYNVKKNSVVFLDEPELSMSFKWRKGLIELFKKHSKKSKIIIASQQLEIIKEEDLEFMIPLIDRS